MENLRAYREELLCRKLSESTIRKYLKDAQDFLEFADGADISMELLIQYKGELLDSFKLSTVNNYLKFCGLDIKLKQEKQQRKTSLESLNARSTLTASGTFSLSSGCVTTTRACWSLRTSLGIARLRLREFISRCRSRSSGRR